ncbi:hypothetical protein [Streptomyces sp. NPDC047841]|uniref:hypothetical protein n=1 Tax=Streptomyces sp. NPDC047841 TaxID=3154708 RepID=UPI003453FB97
MKPLLSTRTRAARSARLARVGGRAVPLALCALLLAACGSERDGGRQEGKDDAGSRTVTARTPSEGPGFTGFMELLDSVAEPCVPQAPATVAPEPSEPGHPRTAPVPLPVLPSAPPVPDATADPVNPRAQVALSGLEKCAARAHTRRITDALEKTPGLTPARVGEALRGLGYLPERIDGPRRSAGGAGFTLDLRIMGGHLCLDGTVTGTTTTVVPYGASPQVACREVRRGAPGVTSSRA